MSQLPAGFVQRLTEILQPSQLANCLASFSDAPVTGLRVNTLRAHVPDVLAELAADDIRPESVSWCSEAFVTPADQRQQLVHSTAFNEARIYIQNLSSLLAPIILAPQPGETVLDLAAAPGGKTLHLAAIMQNQGTISAVEVIRGRCYRLRENVRRYGASIVRTYRTDGRTVGSKTPERFDRVLLDAPCSSEARFRLDRPQSWAYWSERKIREQSRKQKGLLKSAIRAVKPGGTLVYCTCSFAPEENELVVDEQLRRFHGCVGVVPVDSPVDNVQSGLCQWRDRSLHPDLRLAQRILPNQYMHGFFLCSLRKTRSLPSSR